MLYHYIAKFFDLTPIFCRFNHYPLHLLTSFNKNGRQISLSDGQNKRQKNFSCVRIKKEKSQKFLTYVQSIYFPS